jgi:DnaJ-class molecular chaperone
MSKSIKALMKVGCPACHGCGFIGENPCRLCSGRGHVHLPPTPIEKHIERSKRLEL